MKCVKMVSKSKKLCVQETLLIAQEISLVKILCSNVESERRRGLHKLRRWLISRSEGVLDLKEDDLNRLWKGLFYCLWMADKPLYQEEVVENITMLVHCFQKFDAAVLYILSFFNIINQEWFGIDRLRLDKSLMLVRRLIRQSFVLLKKHSWDYSCVCKIADCYRKSLKRMSDGLLYHVSDVYINELAKIGGGCLSDDNVLEMIKPFGECLSVQNSGIMLCHIASTIFLNLMRYSDKGIEHAERFKAWRDRGFPGGTIHAMKKVNNDDDDADDDDSEAEDENGTADHNVDGLPVLDPRAGNVDVEVPVLSYDPKKILDLLSSLKGNKNTTTKARKQIVILMKKFELFLSEDYPLGIKEVEKLPRKENWKKLIGKSAKAMIGNQDYISDSEDLGHLNKESFNSKKTKKSRDNDSMDVNSRLKCRSNITSSSNALKKIKSNLGQSKSEWQVTLVKAESECDGVDKNSCDDRNGHSLVSSSMTWEVTDATKDCDPGRICNHNDSMNLNGRLKRRSNITSSSNAFKKIKINLGDENGINDNGIDNDDDCDDDDDDDDGESEITIERPSSLGSKRKKKKTIKQKAGSLQFTPNKDDIISQPTTAAAETPTNSVTTSTPCTNSTSSTKRKRVFFVLNKNMVQEEREYQRMIRNQPKVYFDGTKQPMQPIFKDKGIRSPINPFYKRFGYTKQLLQQ